MEENAIFYFERISSNARQATVARCLWALARYSNPENGRIPSYSTVSRLKSRI